MPKLIKSTPKYRKHRASGQAVVTIEGRNFYLGPYGTRASHSEYDRIIVEWLTNGRRLPVEPEDQPQLTLVEVMAVYIRFAKTYYRKQHSGYNEVHRIKDAMKPLKALYGRTTAVEFGPKRLKAVRQKMLDDGYSRKHINTQIGRIKRMFKWVVSEEMIPPSVHQALATVEGLKRGRTEARESAPIAPVADSTVNDTLAYMPPAVADMVRLQRFTGARPGEICIIRPGDVDRTQDVWSYVPQTHKTEYKGRQRVILIGPKGQAILRPYLLRPDWEYCFSPKESERHRRELAHQARQTPLSCGNRPGTNRRRSPKRSVGTCYTNDSYRRAIHRAVEKVNKDRAAWNSKHAHSPALPMVEKWSPNRLRHSAATEIRKRFGLEAAQVCLGHAAADVTQVYAQRDLIRAAEVMREVG